MKHILVTLSVPDETVIDRQFADQLHYYLNKLEALGLSVESARQIERLSD
jgi:hypothetical protein